MKVKLVLSAYFALTTLFAISLPEVQLVKVFPPTHGEPSEEWQEYTTIENVKIEFRRQLCTPQNDREQSLVLLRFTNLSDEVVTLSWVVEMWRNDECVNCDRLSNPENARTLTLQPNEVLEGDGSTKSDKRVYIFDHFAKLVPGMEDQRLTHFELKNLKVE